jgi:hypothetical protein
MPLTTRARFNFRWKQVWFPTEIKVRAIHETAQVPKL